MTKRRLYAQAFTVILALIWPDRVVAAQSRQPDPPCAACITITIAETQALLLPKDLDGLTVLVRASGPPGTSLTGALEAILARGGRAGVALTVPRDAPSIERLVFDLKQMLTDYRAAAGPAAVIALVVPAQLKQSLLDRGLSAYADVFLQSVPPGNFEAALELTRSGTDRVAVAAPASEPEAQRFLQSAVQAARLLPEGLVPITDSIARCGAQVGEHFRHPSTQDAIAFLACANAADVRLSTAERVTDRMEVGRLVILRVAAAVGERFADDVQVRASRQLSVEEVLARHQAAVRRQRATVSHTISSGTMSLTFEAPGFAAPVTVTAETVTYVDATRTEIEHRRIRVNGLEFSEGGVPQLPLLEPERVAAAPLTIALTDAYRYRLESDDDVNGIPCYVIRFTPARDGALFSGRAWIAMNGFGMVKVSAAQTGLRGPIVASEQVDEFREVQPGVWLLARSDVRQMYEGPGHRTPIERRISIHTHLVNPAEFAARRAAALASNAVMLRDTPQGYRYLQRRPGNREERTDVVVEVRKPANHVRTVAAGVIIDPNITNPLPFAGISYIDFDLFGTGAQFNGFFGGAFGQMSFSVPSLWKSRWQLGGRAFAIASSYNDRSFRDGREMYEEAVRQRPAHLSIWLVRPLTARISVRGGYDLDYTRLHAAPETAPGFVVPADQVVHAGRFALEGQRAGWSASVWWNPALRAGWRPWGTGSDYQPAHATFQRFGMTVAKSTAVTPRVVTRIEAAWAGGRDLDRFSRYAFGTFDNRLRGYPSALVRYDRGGVLRSAVAWSAARFVRVDGFVDTALVRDPSYGRGLRNYTGIGAAAEAPGPFGLLTALEWGYGFRGVNPDGGRGTQVWRVSVFKVF